VRIIDKSDRKRNEDCTSIKDKNESSRISGFILHASTIKIWDEIGRAESSWIEMQAGSPPLITEVGTSLLSPYCKSR
jgi:hypothetical protein